MKTYKSQVATYTPVIVIMIAIVILVELFASSTFFSFIPIPTSTVVLVAIVILIILFILSKLQRYQIFDDKIRVRHVTEFDIPFSKIKSVTLFSQDSYIRLRGVRPSSVFQNIKLGNRVVEQVVKSSSNSEGSNSTQPFPLDEFNKETSLAKLKMMNTKAIFIRTEEGEVRILPLDPDAFTIDLAARYSKSQGKTLNVGIMSVDN